MSCNISIFITRFFSICSLLILLVIFDTYAMNNNTSTITGLSYKKEQKNNHVIHILTIDPKYFHLQLVKAHNQVFGRETINSIALRKNAIAAINAGFFEIGGSDDGRPSRSLIINGKIFELPTHKQDLLIINDNNIQIKQTVAEILLKLNKTMIIPDKVNNYSNAGEIILYSDTWGTTSLTPYTNKEIIITQDLIISKISNHGDNPIPKKGFILSFPIGKTLPRIKEGDKIDLHVKFMDQNTQETITLGDAISIITGIPLLVLDGKSCDKWDSSIFITKPHARTALGIRPDGKIIMIVAEHSYKQPLKELTIEEVQSILKEEEAPSIEVLTLQETIKILEKHFADINEIKGLTIPELAEYMIELGCSEAINLDGGGSSAMFLDGRIVNEVMGDKDEAKGKRVVRPVSDAIILVPK